MKIRNIKGKFISQKFIKICCGCGSNFEVIESRIKKAKYCSNHCYWKNLTGKKLSISTRIKMHVSGKKHIHTRKELDNLKKGSMFRFRKGHIGKDRKHTDLSRMKISALQQGISLDKWKGYITPINTKVRNSVEYHLWRTAVFERDNYTCQNCGDKQGGNLECHHIKSFSKFPELRFTIDNGQTLCVGCHKNTDSYLWKERWNYAS